MFSLLPLRATRAPPPSLRGSNNEVRRASLDEKRTNTRAFDGGLSRAAAPLY
jgi:hypothetical protein